MDLNDVGDGNDVEVMVVMMTMMVMMVMMMMMMLMVMMVIITIGCQCMETKEMQALENDYASAEADEGLVVQPTCCKRNSDGDGEDHQEDDELFLKEVLELTITFLLPTTVARAMVTCKAQRTEGPPLKALRRPLRPLLGAAPLRAILLLATSPPRRSKPHHPLQIFLSTL